MAAGCGSADFTLEDLERLNSYDAIFGKYSSMRTLSTFYDFELPGMDRGDFTQDSVYVQRADEVSVYTEFGFGYAYAIEGRNHYVSDNGVYSITAFLDDEYFDTYYLPYVTLYFAYAPTEGEEVVSVSVSKGVRTVTTNVRASAAEDFAMLGIPDGIIESVYELDAKSGLLMREINYLIPDDGERRLMSDTVVEYGKHDNFTVPEYVRACTDMSVTRTVHFIRFAGTVQEKVYTFTLPKNIAVYPATMEYYYYFTDAELTVPYDWPSGDFPDEQTLYMIKSE
jgi:hypothetical protein